MKKLMLIAIVTVSFLATSCDKIGDIKPKGKRPHADSTHCKKDTTTKVL